MIEKMFLFFLFFFSTKRTIFVMMNNILLYFCIKLDIFVFSGLQIILGSKKSFRFLDGLQRGEDHLIPFLIRFVEK